MIGEIPGLDEYEAPDDEGAYGLGAPAFTRDDVLRYHLPVPPQPVPAPQVHAALPPGIGSMGASRNTTAPLGDVAGAVRALHEQGARKAEAAGATGQAMQGQAAVKAAGAEDLATSALDYQADLRAAQDQGDDAVEQARTRHAAALKTYQGARLEDYWTSRSTGTRIGSALMQALGAIGAGLARGPNYALKILEDDIEHDIKRQTQWIGLKKDSEVAAAAGVTDAKLARTQLIADAQSRRQAAYESIAKRLEAKLIEAGADVDSARNDERVVAMRDHALDAQLKASELMIHEGNAWNLAQARIAATAARRKTGGGGGGGGGGNLADIHGPNGEAIARLAGPNKPATWRKAEKLNAGIEDYRNMRGLGVGLQESLRTEIGAASGIAGSLANKVGINTDSGKIIAQRQADVARLIGYVNTAAGQGVINAGDEPRVKSQLLPYEAMLIKGGPSAVSQLNHFLAILDDAMQRKLASNSLDATRLLPAVRGDAGSIAPNARAAGKTAAIVRSPAAPAPAVAAPAPAAAGDAKRAAALAYAAQNFKSTDPEARRIALGIFAKLGQAPPE